jgi:hypothetical protein
VFEKSKKTEEEKVSYCVILSSTHEIFDQNSLHAGIVLNMEKENVKGQYKFDGASYSAVAPDAFNQVSKNIKLL